MSVVHWEKDQTDPEVRHWPAILGFLGYDPRRAPKTLGEKVRNARVARGLSQDELARRLRIDAGTVADLEGGVSQTGARLAVKVLGHLGLDAPDLCSFPRRLRQYRKRHRLTTVGLAKQFEVHEDTIHAWESGKQLPRAEKLIAVDGLLGLDHGKRRRTL